MNYKIVHRKSVNINLLLSAVLLMVGFNTQAQVIRQVAFSYGWSFNNRILSDVRIVTNKDYYFGFNSSIGLIQFPEGTSNGSNRTGNVSSTEASENQISLFESTNSYNLTSGMLIENRAYVGFVYGVAKSVEYSMGIDADGFVYIEQTSDVFPTIGVQGGTLFFKNPQLIIGFSWDTTAGTGLSTGIAYNF